MIQYNPKSWLKLIFSMHQSGLMRYLAPTVLGIGVLTWGMVFAVHYWKLEIPSNFSIHTIIGLVLGLVLAFRTNTAYDRWWEGRKCFGSLTNSSRNLAIKFHGILPYEDEVSRAFYYRSISNFYFALKEHLRNGVDPEDLDLEGLPYANSITAAQHKPAHIVGHMQRYTADLLQRGRITGDQYIVLSRDIDNCMEVGGACERIRNTPIPYSYSTFIKKVIFFYLITLPLGLLTTMGYWSVPMVMFCTYVIAGIEVLAEEIEDPFGTDVNDLDTDGMSRNIRKNIREILLGAVPEKETAA